MGNRTVTVLHRGTSLPLDDAARSRIGQEVETLLISCADRERKLVPPPDWDRLLKRERLVRVVYSAPVTLDTTTKPGLTLTEILVPLTGSYAGNVLVRNGETIYSPFSACDATIMGRIAALIPK